MTVLAVDLAAKYSAACLMGEDFTVLKQFDSWQQTEEQFIYLCVGQWFRSQVVDIPIQELRIDVFRAGADRPCHVRITHLPTGTVADAEERSELSGKAAALRKLHEKLDPYPEVLVVEDLPHGLKYSTLIKTVCRLQGRFIQAMHEMPEGRTEDVLFLAPAEWRRTYPGLERGTGPDAVVPVAAELGYEPPTEELAERANGVKGGKAIARKVATDYCSAYLIARWAIDTKTKHGTYDVVGTSRYDTTVIRKKDFDDQAH